MSRIRDPVLFLTLDPGSGYGIQDGKKSRSGIRDEHLGSYFWELGIKILEFFYTDTGCFQPWIRDKQSGSSTLLCLENSTEMLDDFSTSSFICKECCFSSVAVLQIWIRILILIQLGWWLGTFLKMIFMFWVPAQNRSPSGRLSWRLKVEGNI